jgi:dynein heavy chain 1
MEAISLDLNDQLIRLLGSRKLMHLDYQEFERLMAQLNQVFEVWDEQLKDFTNVAREIVRKRSEKFIPIKVVTAHSRLQERINFIWNFRRQHYQLHDTIVKVSDDGATIAVKDIDDAYECVRNINVLDISEDGTEIWVAGESSYNSRVSRVENQITARLRDLLAAARNASEMFRVFSRYNALFIRPKIRGAIQEYQTQLIENVKQDITKLHDKFKMQYQHSAACKMSAVRDIPPVAGAIIWGMIFFVVGKLIFSILCFS